MNDSVYNVRDGYDELRRHPMAESAYVNYNNSNHPNSVDFKYVAKVLIGIVGFFCVYTLYGIKDAVQDVVIQMQVVQQDVAVLKNDVTNIKDKQKENSPRLAKIEQEVLKDNDIKGK